MNANVLIAKKWHMPFFSERRATRENFRFSYNQTFIISFIVMTALLLYYAALQNQNATRWYDIRNLQVETRSLHLKENLLDIRIAEWRSIDVILNSPIAQNMQEIQNPAILVMKDSQFALNN